jgi:hypothetical protein
MRFWFRNGPFLLCAATVISVAGCVDDSTGDVRQAVDLNSNVIHGTIAFTNTNPAVLAVLHGPGQSPPGMDDGFHYMVMRAFSTNVSPPLENSSAFYVQPPSTRTSVDYELVNEAGPAGSGIVYSVFADAYMDGTSDLYRFAHRLAAPLERNPAGPVTVDFVDCAGILDVRWQDAGGNPVTVGGGHMFAYREIAPGSGFDFQAQALLHAGSSHEHLAVRGDGSLFQVEVYYDTGSDPTSDRIRHLYRTFVTVACDQVVEIVIVVPDGATELGTIVGEIDMLGELEHPSTSVWAESGPFGNYRYDVLAANPSQGPFTLENLVPSDSVSPEQGYIMYGQMTFTHEGNYQFFRTPALMSGNGRVLVDAAQTVDLGDTFVMDPGFVGGDIYLAGPPPGIMGTCVRALDIPRDPDGDGFPSSFNSLLEAWGIDQRAANATKTAIIGFSQAAFQGAYDPTPGVQGFVGSYEMALGGLLQEATRWQTSIFRPYFLNTTTPSFPVTYQNTALQIVDQRSTAAVEVVPGQTVDQPVHHCFGQLNLAYFSSGAQFYNPRTFGNGQFTGLDFEGNPASYSVQLYYAYGTPLSNAPGTEGMVVMCLPEGTYNFTPTVTAVNPNGTTSETQLPSVTGVEVSCREVKTITPELSMDLEATPVCTAGDTLVLTGNVDSQDVPPQPVSSITTSVNGAGAVPVCTNCGVDPAFSAEVALAACENSIVVRAEDAAGSFAQIERTVTRDGNAPELDGCADITVAADPALGGAYVEYAVTGSDDCTAGVGVVCDVASGSFFTAGQSTSVTCRAVDTCGNEATCSFAVRVEAPATCESPDPREQDYWRTQCNYRGLDGTPPDPAWTAEAFQELIDGIQPEVQAVCGASESTCQALNPYPYWDICEQACQHYTAVLLNIASDLLPASCCTVEGDAGEVAARLAAMIAAGECAEVVDIAYELNRGCLFCEDGH